MILYKKKYKKKLKNLSIFFKEIIVKKTRQTQTTSEICQLWKWHINSNICSKPHFLFMQVGCTDDLQITLLDCSLWILEITPCPCPCTFFFSFWNGLLTITVSLPGDSVLVIGKFVQLYILEGNKIISFLHIHPFSLLFYSNEIFFLRIPF